MRRYWIGGLLVLAGVVPGFLSGVVAGRTLFATSLNTGLLNAFSSVGQNLLGDAAFGASAIPPTPILPNGGVQIDVSNATQIPVSMDVFIPPSPIIPTEPCKRAAQVTVKPDGGISILYDSTLVSGDSVQLQSWQTAGTPNVPAACPATAPTF